MKRLPSGSGSIATAEFVAECSDMMIPLGGSLSYFSVVPLDEQETQRLILDPAGALPPRVCEILPNLCLVLVPYLAMDVDGGVSGVRVAFQPPGEEIQLYVAMESLSGENCLFIAVLDEGFYDTHIVFYRALAEEIVRRAGEDFARPFSEVLDNELRVRAHGEVHERAWKLKKDLLQLKRDHSDGEEVLADYRRQALEDTLTLYLHGLCCDVEVDAGPTQLPSKYVRKRLLLLKDQLPPPDEVALFPEDLDLL